MLQVKDFLSPGFTACRNQPVAMCKLQAVAVRIATCRFCEATGRVGKATGRNSGPLPMEAMNVR